MREVDGADSGGNLLKTNNPGPWFLHCHIDWHLQAGFAIVLAEDVADVASVNSPPCESLSDLTDTVLLISHCYSRLE